jgi:hypothetical protein
VGCDGRQDLVAAEEDAVLLVVEAQVVVCVARCVEADPFAIAEADPVEVVHPVGRPRRQHPLQHLGAAGAHLLEPLARWSQRLASPR